MALTKAGGTWVTGDKFFDREAELATLLERVRDGVHTLMTGQRRMGKTSLIRELQARLATNGDHETIFVDLEDAATVEEAVAELAVQAKSLQSTSQKIQDIFANALHGVSQKFEEINVYELKVKFRAGIDSETWRTRGDQVFAALSENPKPVNLAIDELPIFINRILKGSDSRITSEGIRNADLFMSWLRRNSQSHQRQISIVVSGSIGLEPVLQEVGLSAHANNLSAFELKPWDHETAVDCLGALANSYGLNMTQEVRRAMCDNLRCCIPHHVQLFFDHLHQYLRLQGSTDAELDDVEFVYENHLLAVRGQVHLEHYQSRLRMVLGDEKYGDALELLTEAAVNQGFLARETFQAYVDLRSTHDGGERQWMNHLLYILEHDGYLEKHNEGWRFVSKLLEDWWRRRHRSSFTPLAKR